MKFSIASDELVGALKPVMGVDVSKGRNAIPILSNLLLACSQGTLRVTATDTEIQIITETVIEDSEDGEITVPGKKLWDICKALPAQSTASLSLKDAFAILRSGRGRFSLATLPARDYPAMDTLATPAEGWSFFVEESALRQCIERTVFAAAKDDVRYYLNGVLLEVIKGRLRTVATDGHRLAMATLELNTAIEAEKKIEVILPQKCCRELLKILGEGDRIVYVAISDTAVQFSLPSIQLTSRLIEGKYIVYEDVLKNARANKGDWIAIDRDTLRKTISRVSIIADNRYQGVAVKVSKGEIEVSADNNLSEKAEESIEIETSGVDILSGFRASYLLDALAAIPTETVAIKITGEDSPMLLMPEGSTDYEQLVMPMRLR
jgi:DNA polymerase-3 subunit beta